MISKELLKKAASSLEISLDEEALERFDLYASLLVELNSKVNLTAVTEPEEIVFKHFADSLSVLKYAEPKESASLIDVGSGAGFPGLPLLIARPKLSLTMIDGTKKKIDALNEILKALGLKARALHLRAEEAGTMPEFRESFDFATARAVAKLRVLEELCLPLVKKDGFFLALKGPKGEEEIRDAEKAALILGGKITKSDSFYLPLCGKRLLIHTKKLSPTPEKYPRPSVKISKKPL